MSGFSCLVCRVQHFPLVHLSHLVDVMLALLLRALLPPPAVAPLLPLLPLPPGQAHVAAAVGGGREALASFSCLRAGC